MYGTVLPSLNPVLGPFGHTTYIAFRGIRFQANMLLHEQFTIYISN